MDTYNVPNMVFRVKDIIMVEIDIVPTPKSLQFTVYYQIQIDVEQIITQKNIYFGCQ